MSVGGFDLGSLFTEAVQLISGGAVGGAVALLLNDLRQKQDRHRAARNLAIRLSEQFERFAVACADTIATNRESRRNNPHDYSGIVAIPAHDSLPEDEHGWRSIDPLIAIEARTFGNRVQSANDFVRNTGEYGDADDVEDEIVSQSIGLGVAASGLVSKLRDTFSLPEATYPYDIADLFHAESERIAERKALEVRSAAEFWEDQKESEAGLHGA